MTTRVAKVRVPRRGRVPLAIALVAMLLTLGTASGTLTTPKPSATCDPLYDKYRCDRLDYTKFTSTTRVNQRLFKGSCGNGGCQNWADLRRTRLPLDWIRVQPRRHLWSG